MRTVVLVVAVLWAAVVGAQSKNIWLSPEEIKALPNTGSAWTAMKAQADASWTVPDLSDQDSLTDVRCLAAAFVFVRGGDPKYQLKAQAALVKIPGTESDSSGPVGRSLALGRGLGAYVIAADLVGIPADRESAWRSWLAAVRTKTLPDGRSLVSTHETRPNNWGAHAGWSRACADVYLGDATDLAKAAKVFRGYLGDRDSFAGFDFGTDLSWQSDPAHPVGINPKGALIQGHSVDGVLPDDQRRGGSFRWPPFCENYVFEALQGVLGQGWVLARHGYPDVWSWEDQAVLRAFNWLYKTAGCSATGDDSGEPWVLAAIYGTDFPKVTPTQVGKGWGYGDWWAVKVAPPPAVDFQSTWEFHVQPDQSWQVHRLNAAVDEITGSGATPEAALADYVQKNPDWNK